MLMRLPVVVPATTTLRSLVTNPSIGLPTVKVSRTGATVGVATADEPGVGEADSGTLIVSVSGRDSLLVSWSIDTIVKSFSPLARLTCWLQAPLASAVGE